MLAFRLLRHSVLMLVYNFRAVLKLSIPYLVLLSVSQFITLKYQTAVLQSGFVAPSMWMPWAILAVSLAAMLVYLATCVSWHRHVLLSEEPNLLEQGRGRQVLSYFGTGILISLIMIVPVTVVIGITMSTFGDISMTYSMGVTGLAIMALIFVIVSALALRLATALPGAALRRPKPIKTAWKATSGHMGSFLLLGVLSMLVQAVVSLLPALIITLTGSTIAVILAWIVTTWAVTLLGLSMLTTLWGYFVEGRDLR
jgi:hypothetical protein